MDRGRVGFNAIGNKCIRENMINERRDTHLAKLKKIKNRRPGTSTTVDCTPPKAIEAAKCNPRKKAISQEWSGIIEKENKALLQRISAVLTAPPKIDDGEYLKMRKICASLKSSGGAYEKRLQEKKTKQMFAQIKKIGPYYNPKQWELDYRRQLVGQKFMRQVTYQRPPDFVDPFAPPPSEASATGGGQYDDDDSEVRSKNGSLLVDKYRVVNAARSYSHMSVCRNVRRSNSSNSNNSNGSASGKRNLSKSTPILSLVSGGGGGGGGNTGAGSGLTAAGGNSGRNSGRNTGTNNSLSNDGEYGDEEYNFDEEGGGSSSSLDAAHGIAVMDNSEANEALDAAGGYNGNEDGGDDGYVEEKRVMLAEVTRLTKIFDPSYSEDQSFPLEATIECFLIDNTTSVVITACTVDSVGGAPLVAEAEIDLNELLSIREDLVLFRRLPGTEPPATDIAKESATGNSSSSSSSNGGGVGATISGMDSLFAPQDPRNPHHPQHLDDDDEHERTHPLYEYDVKALSSLATDIVHTVEIRVEDSIPRLVLNISLDNIDQTPGVMTPLEGDTGGGSVTAAAAATVAAAASTLSSPPRLVRSPSTLAMALGRNSASGSGKKKRSEGSIAEAVRLSGSAMEDGLRQSESLRVCKTVVLHLTKAVVDTSNNNNNRRKEGSGGSAGTGVGGTSSGVDTSDEDLVALARSSDKLKCSVTVSHVADDKVTITVDVLETSRLQWPVKQQQRKALLSPKASSKIERMSSKNTGASVGSVGVVGSTSESASQQQQHQTQQQTGAGASSPILLAGDSLSSSIGLPSIMQADMDLIVEYIDNIFLYLSIEYDGMNEACALKLK